MFSFLIKPKAKIKLCDNSFGNHEFILKSPIVTIGRSKSAFSDKLIYLKNNKIEIAGNDITKRISFQHGLLTWDKINHQYLFKDQSEKGSIINGDPLDYHEERLLEDNSEIIIHPFRFTIHYT